MRPRLPWPGASPATSATTSMAAELFLVESKRLFKDSASHGSTLCGAENHELPLPLLHSLAWMQCEDLGHDHKGPSSCWTFCHHPCPGGMVIHPPHAFLPCFPPLPGIHMAFKTPVTSNPTPFSKATVGLSGMVSLAGYGVRHSPKCQRGWA